MNEIDRQIETTKFIANYETIKLKIKRLILQKKIDLENEKISITDKIKKYREKLNIPDQDPIPEDVKTTFLKKELSLKRYLSELENQLDVIRPSSKEDIEYRNRVLRNISELIKENTPEELPFRFHGTSIYNTKEIISDGGISSSINRLGISTSLDIENQISVTTTQTIATTVNNYIDLTKELYTIPPGCIFVLWPSSDRDAQAGQSMIMENINFKEEPHRLFKILTSNENIPKVKEWIEINGLNPEIVIEFFEFPKQMNKLDQQLKSGEKKVTDFIPWSKKKI